MATQSNKKLEANEDDYEDLPVSFEEIKPTSFKKVKRQKKP